MTQILIQTKGFELTPALQATCTKGTTKLVEREGIGEKIEFFLEHEGKGAGKIFTAKISLTKQGTEIFAQSRQSDMYQAIRQVCKKARKLFDDDEK